MCVDPHRDNESLWINLTDTTTSSMSSSWPAAATSPELNSDCDVGGLLDAVSSEGQCSRAQVGSRCTWSQFIQLFQMKQGFLTFLWIIHHFLWTVQQADTFFDSPLVEACVLEAPPCGAQRMMHWRPTLKIFRYFDRGPSRSQSSPRAPVSHQTF